MEERSHALGVSPSQKLRAADVQKHTAGMELMWIWVKDQFSFVFYISSTIMRGKLANKLYCINISRWCLIVQHYIDACRLVTIWIKVIKISVWSVGVFVNEHIISFAQCKNLIITSKAKWIEVTTWKYNMKYWIM